MLGREHVFGHPALTDKVTGLANRLHFELVYSYLFEGADRGVPLTVLLISTEETDEKRLAAFGSRIQRTTRTSDLVAYMGHGRFVSLLLGTNLSGARIAADRVELALEGTYEGPLCMALATWNPEMKEPHQLLEAADSALRKAKVRGGGLEMA